MSEVVAFQDVREQRKEDFQVYSTITIKSGLSLRKSSTSSIHAPSQVIAELILSNNLPGLFAVTKSKSGSVNYYRPSATSSLVSFVHLVASAGKSGARATKNPVLFNLRLDHINHDEPSDNNDDVNNTENAKGDPNPPVRIPNAPGDERHPPSLFIYSHLLTHAHLPLQQISKAGDKNILALLHIHRHYP